MPPSESQAGLLDVFVVTPQGVLFQGKAQSVILPGENGVFEVLINHKPLIGRVVCGELFVDERPIPLKRGVVKVMLNRVVAIVEGISH